MKHAVTKEEVTPESAAALQRERAMKAAMASPEHLKLWMQESGRRWMVFDGVSLVDAMPWPGGVQEVMDVIQLYAQHRRSIPSGRFEKQEVMGQVVDVEIFKTEKLELAELDRAIRYLVAQAYEWDPKWSLENPAL